VFFGCSLLLVRSPFSLVGFGLPLVRDELSLVRLGLSAVGEAVSFVGFGLPVVRDPVSFVGLGLPPGDAAPRFVGFQTVQAFGLLEDLVGMATSGPRTLLSGVGSFPSRFSPLVGGFGALQLGSRTPDGRIPAKQPGLHPVAGHIVLSAVVFQGRARVTHRDIIARNAWIPSRRRKVEAKSAELRPIRRDWA
jgi:hypothetical protein